MAEPQKFYSLRVTGKDEQTSQYGVLVFLVDFKNSKIFSSELIASNSQTAIAIPLESTYKDFINLVQRLKYNNDYSQKTTLLLTDILKTKSNSESFLEELIHYLEHKMEDRVIYLFSQIFMQAFGNSNTTVIEIKYDLIDSQDADKTSITFQDSTKENQQDTFQAPSGTLLVNYKFALSPVSGVKVTELREGMRIVVKLIPGSPNTDQVINQFQLKEEGGNIRNIPANIYKIKSEGGKTTALIKITENIYGRYVEEEQAIKVKMATKETLLPIQNVKKENTSTQHTEDIDGDNTLFLTVLGIIAIICIAGALVLFL